MNVALIEPDKLTAKLVTELFTADGHVVRWEKSAQAGIHLMDGERPDVVILEVQLGIHNGVEFLYEMRSYPEWSQVPVIIYSINRAVTLPEFQTAFRQLGVAAVCYKATASLDDLRDAVARNVLTAG